MLIRPVTSGSIIRELASNHRGNVIAILALLLPVFMLVLGGSIDAGVAYGARSKLQGAADAAVLAAASSGSNDFAFLSDLADQYFEANTTDQNSISDLTSVLSQSGGELRYSVSAQVETAFLKLIGKNEIGLEIAAQANRLTFPTDKPPALPGDTRCST
jgi:Flp pilus assembly protein TadG